MGNAASEPTRLKDDLMDMQRSLQAICMRCRPPPVLRPGEIFVNNVIVTTREDVQVVVGPVVGKIEFQRARVLLEVNRYALVTAHVSTLDIATTCMVEMPQYQVSMHCKANEPLVFVFDRLVPGKRYHVTFGGIRKQDVETKGATFRTQSLEKGNKWQLLVVNGNNVYDLESGQGTLWTNVRQRIEQDQTHLVLHLGGQVAMERQFDKAVQLLLLYGQGLANETMTATTWAMMEEKAMQVLRGAYQRQWTLSSPLQFVLANASNLMMWNDADIYPHFTTRDEFAIDHERPTLQMQVIRTVTRCARRLFHEYQRQLWDHDFGQVGKRELQLVTIAKKALAFTGQICVLSNHITKAAEEQKVQQERHELDNVRRIEKTLYAMETEKAKLEKELTSFKQLVAPGRGEEFLYEVGSIGVLVLDLRSSRLEPGGSQARENALLSNMQWRFIDETLERASLQLLVVCSEAPLINDAMDSAVAAVSGRLETCWSANDAAQKRLLSQLFDWKAQQPNREFVILGGATPTRCFGRMRIKDTKLRIEADQVTVGTISAVPNASVIPQRKGLLYDRFEFGHVDDVVSANGFLTLRLESGPKNTIQVTRVGKEEQRDDVPKVLLGPVVGWVDAWCAVILLEIDRDADIVCFVENPLTRETRRVFQRFRTHQANSFCITHLRSEHYYRVSFENVQHSERFHASFTMLAKSPTHFDVIALCNDNKPLCISDMLHKDSKGSSLWHAIAEHSMEVPFVALNLTLQLGGQFHVESNAHVREALTHADEMRTSVTPSKERKDRTRAAILHCFGAMYRETWNTPGIRQCLAHGAHVLLTNDNDQLPVTHQDAEDPHHVNVRTLLAKVHEKYQNLLLPPSKRLREDERRWEKPLHHCFGAFGLFVLPLQELEGSCVHELTWQSLRGLLATPTLSDLLLVTTAPLIEESFEDIQAKTSMDAACRSKFGAYPNDVALLLELLFDWQRGTTSAQRNKQVVLLSGSKCQSLDSIIRQVYKTQERMQTTTGFPNLPTADVHELFQCVVGPVQSASNAGPCPSAFFTQGTLLGRYTFHHSPVRKSLPVSSTGTATSQKATHEGVHDCPMSTQVLVHLQLAIGNNEHRDTLKCTFVSHQVIQVDKALDKDVADERVMLKIQTRCCQVDTWQLSTAIPSWLQEFVVPSTTGKEDEQTRHRLEYLRTREHEIRTTCYETFCLANGLVTLSRGKQCVNALTTSFKRAHELGGSGWQEKFPLPPSQFIVAFTLQQLRTSKSLVQQLPAVGAMELDEYALVFEQSFMNAWLFNERL